MELSKHLHNLYLGLQGFTNVMFMSTGDNRRKVQVKKISQGVWFGSLNDLMKGSGLKGL